MPLRASLSALLLHVALLLALVWGAPLSGLSPHWHLLTPAGHAHAAPLSDHGEGGGDGGEDNSGPGSGDEERLEGSIVSFPVALVGTWSVLVEEDKTIAVIATDDTRFDPERPSAFAPGLWVEVRGEEQSDGTIIAERIRVDDYEAGEIVVRLQSASYRDQIANEYDLTLKATLLGLANIYLFTTSDDEEWDVVEDIEDEPGVIWAEVNFVNSVPEDDGYKTWGWGGIEEPDAYVNQHAYTQINWNQADRPFQGNGVVVAVLDTGVYTQHEQFAGKLQLPALDVIGDDMDPSDVGPGLAWGHGTHVAGVIAAMAPGATILPVRVLDSNGRGNSFLLAYAIEWVAQQPGVKVINLSLGTESDSQILHDVIDRVLEQGIVVVAAAGNNGNKTIQYPAGYENVIGVTAVDVESHKANFANYGKDWIDLAAPGVGIMSTMINEEGAGYASWSGTSMSTAFVSGAAVLVAGQGDAQVATSVDIADKLLNSGALLDPLNPLFLGEIGRLLDVSAALDLEAVEPAQQLQLYIPNAQR